MRLKMLVGVMLAAGLLAAGCGGDDDEVSEADFQAAVAEACDTAAEALLSQTADLQALLQDPEAAEAYVTDELIPLFDDLQADLEAIEAPSGQADDYEELLALGQENRDTVADDPAGLFDQSSETSQQLDENNTEADELASALGLPADCGEPGGGASGATGA